uniref:peroxidase n=1 Tax=Nicotiana tabacum TaxID=4097 RepID=A0A1S3YRH6_TOBAC|nr:PREDICTED: zinc finger MYM-type protein 1-like [Nicotiana tabacum]
MKRFYPPVSSKLPQSSSSSLIVTPVEENLNQLVEQPQSSKKQRQGIDLDSLKTDPKERLPIRDFHPNEHDEIRREYLRRGPCQPRYHKFPQRDFSGLKRHFNPKWFKGYHNWLEYSVIEDAAYCLYCYLFQDEGIHQGGGDVFSSLGFKSWHKKNRLDMHESSSIHNQAKRKCEDLLKQKQSIQTSFDRCGSVGEHFIGIVHVRNTTSLCLKKAIFDYLAQHSLSLSYVRGQCYDGASNMQGDLRGLKTLIQQESKSAYSIHCFAHQLQLTLVAVSKKCLEVGELVLLVSNILNIVGGSFKRMDDLRESQAEKVQEALDMGELETGRGLNQELGLARAADTCWDSHYKSFKNFISMFGSIIDVLDTIVVDARTLEERAKAKGYLSSCQTFEVAFMLHLMRDVLGITNELNTSLQKKEQNIENAILLVEVAKRRLQKLREEEWDSLIDKVSAFCVKYNILIPNFDDFYVNSGRSRRKVADYTILHHYRVDIFFKIIDWQVQELNARFNEVTTNLLVGVACLNRVDSFSSFDINKILRMAELYPDDFSENITVTLKNQLETYIVDVRDVDKKFSNLQGLVNLFETLVKTKKHLNYPFVFRLVKFALLLPVATATVERTFSAMKLIKSELRNQMNDEFMSSCLLQLNFYAKSCPKAEKIIQDYVQKHIPNTPSLAAALLRLQFHDCFVKGCDGSMLLNFTSSTKNQTEKVAIPIQTQRLLIH